MEIEKNMYVRTKKCGISKICYIHIINNEIQWIYLNNQNATLEKDILKASYNIIDLIEEGDYVNGYCVLMKDGELKNFDLNIEKWVSLKELDNNGLIDDIVTKEQFNCWKYEVK